jgi:hypothetical protein
MEIYTDATSEATRAALKRLGDELTQRDELARDEDDQHPDNGQGDDSDGQGDDSDDEGLSHR